jgi:hypothetical protein
VTIVCLFMNSNIKLSWFVVSISITVHCSLRLWYYYSKGIHGFRQDKSKALKALSRIKEIAPDMSQHDIKLEKMKLINLLNGEVTFKITEENSGDVDDLTHLTAAESTRDET